MPVFDDSPAPGAAPDPLAWLMDTLRQAMEELMASDAPPLQKANSLARLAALYLKSSNAVALKAENKALERRLAEVEAQLALESAAPESPESASGALAAAAAPTTGRFAALHTVLEVALDAEGPSFRAEGSPSLAEILQDDR